MKTKRVREGQGFGLRKLPKEKKKPERNGDVEGSNRRRRRERELNEV